MWEDVIHRDLEFLNVPHIERDYLDAAERHIHGGWRVVILNNTIYTKAVGAIAAGDNRHGMLLVLLKASCRFHMPDVEFVVHPYDTRKIIGGEKAVVFSSTKDITRDDDLLVPYQSLLWPRLHAQQYNSSDLPWHMRKPQVVWRGSTTGGIYTQYSWAMYPRSQASLMCAKSTGLCDAGYTQVAERHCTAAAEQDIRKRVGYKNVLTNQDVARYDRLHGLGGVHEAAAVQELALSMMYSQK